MGMRQHLRYRFDNLMSRGVSAQIGLLGLLTLALILITVIAVFITNSGPSEGRSFGLMMWRAVTHTLDPGTLGNDALDDIVFLLIMLFVTLGGIFIVSALIGVLNQGFGSMIERLRRGRSVVMEKDHTVILGWTPKIHTLLRELAVANANQKQATVVILADRDKVDMDAEVAPTIRRTHLRVVTRTGNPMTTADLALVSLEASKAVIALAPEMHENGDALAPHESDTVVLKELLAIAKSVPMCGKLHVVAEIFDEKTADVARMVAGEKAGLILASPLISRLLVQTGRQSGLSVVYTELLDFAGSEMYMQREPALVGVTFRDALFRYGTSSLIGVRTADGQTLVPPDFDRVFAAGDEVIAISEDDDTVVLDGAPPKIPQGVLVEPPQREVEEPERTLVLGAGVRLERVLSELDKYVAVGSSAHVVAEAIPERLPAFVNMTLTTRIGDLTDRRVLDSLDVTSFDHILVLSEVMGRTQEMADARTTVTLLHLRDLERLSGKKVPITSEILDINNRDLATVAEADDFIVSNTLVSLMVSQIAENPHLIEVFDTLFDPSGYEIYLKPATHFVEAGEYEFGVMVEAAARRKQMAIGYRLAKSANDPTASFGVCINPAKTTKVRLGAADKLIVVAEH
jgi:Castor and Pollux protein voltage-gated ion channel component/calcium-activated potassium channel-like protein